MDNIMANLEFLDYEPQDSEMSQGFEFMSREDSVEMANWLEQETKRLAAKEKDLERRERELALLNKKVEQKLLKVEQIESGRIANLAKLYDDMEPLAVAKLAVNLDDATVVAILPRMKPKNAAQVLAMLPPQRAAKLSKMMITIAEN
jgi:flagellar motility protein MotE (MotC chaperone)